MPNEPIKQVNKLMVGQLDFSFLPSVPVLPGTSVLNGPVWIGTGQPLPTANCMIGPGLNPITLEVKGISNIIGVTNVTGTVNRAAVLTATGASFKIGVSIKQALSAVFGLKTNAATQITAGPKICQSNINTPRIDAAYGNFITCQATLGIFSQVAAPFKKFDIPHPNKEGYRLVHTCLEGPEIGVYYRGRLVGNNVIELPDYWKGLIDPETITVDLTPHTFYQELYVKNIEWGRKINIVNNSGGSIDCSYVIWAERIDVEKLQIEYKEE
jgi:hypothetical protein